MNYSKFIYIITILFITSCNSNNSSTVSSSSSIETIIEELKTTNSLDNEKVNKLISLIDDFVLNDSESNKVPEYLELKAKYLTALGKNQESLNVYKTIYTKYSSYVNHSDALFMMAFIYENNLNDKKNAEIHYQKYLNEFPSGEFYNDAVFSIENINVSPAELMKKFEEMNKNRELKQD